MGAQFGKSSFDLLIGGPRVWKRGRSATARLPRLWGGGGKAARLLEQRGSRGEELLNSIVF